MVSIPTTSAGATPPSSTSSSSPAKAEVGRLVLFHHDPYHDDDQLDELRAVATKMLGRGDDAVQLAYEGMRIDFSETGAKTG